MKAILTILTILALNAAAEAALMPNDFMLIRKPSSINQGTLYQVIPTMLSAQLVHDYQTLKSQEKSLDVAKFVPMNLTPTENSGLVFSKIADHSMQSLMNSPEFKNTRFGQTASTVEHSLKQEVVFGGQEENGVKHKINFQVQAFQAAATIDYTGYTNARLTYQASTADLGLEVYKKLNSKRDLVLSHNMRPDQRLSQVSVRWNF